MKTQTMAMVLIVAVTAFTGCGEAGVHAVTGADWELLTEFTGPSGDLKGDAPNAVARWEIHQADDEILVLQALDGMERVYLEAWIQEDESRVRVDYVLPVHCSMITDRQLGIIIENTCSFDESRALGVSALDFITDLQSSGQGFQAALGKADGFSDSACVTARVVVGGLAGLLTTVVIFHESIIAGTVIGLFTGAVGLTVTGAALGAAVFAVSAVGTAWAVDKACTKFLQDAPASLTGCVAGCDEEGCIEACVAFARSAEGIAEGRAECLDECVPDDADGVAECAGAYGDPDILRQTLLVQCAMGCDPTDQECSQGCVVALSL